MEPRICSLRLSVNPASDEGMACAGELRSSFSRASSDKALLCSYSSTSTPPTLRKISVRSRFVRAMSLDPPSYLLSVQNNIRTRPIPWDGAVRAGTISEDQLSKIRAVDKVRKEQRKQTVEGDLSGYRTLFVGGDGKQSVLESTAKSGHVVQYILVLLGDLIDGELHNLFLWCIL
jgi:hypothetical protein